MKGNKKKGSAWDVAKAVVWGLCVLALVFSFALAGCSNGSGGGGDGDGDGGDGGIPAAFVGTWTGTKAGSPSTSVTLTINSNGTYSLTYSGGLTESGTGKFRVENGGGILRHPSDAADYGTATLNESSLRLMWPTLGTVNLTKP